jgi:LPXTG-motif cell wall-anchored protein
MPFASRVRLGLAVSCAGLALAAPVAHAQGQGAGDDQYADPFSGQATPTATPRATATAAPQAPPPAQSSAAPAATATAAPPPAQASSAAGGPTLPYTGVDAWIPGLSGALLLGGGLVLRRRLRD